jgi:Uma2 family endonuclease
VRVASSLAATDDSEPEPDIAVVPRGDHHKAHPTTAYLLIEVSKTSLRKDRAVKTDVYAEAGVDEYWIVNLVDRCIEVHRSPRNGRYEQSSVHRAGDRIALVRFPDVAIAVSDVLPA